MNADNLIEALRLPQATMLNRRLPKALIIENGANTAADRRLVRERVRRADWVASLKPSNIGLAATVGDDGVNEIAVITVHCAHGSQTDRLAEMMHRAIPYHVLLVIDEGDHAAMSVADKRQSLADSDKTVLELGPVNAELSTKDDPATSEAIARAIAFDNDVYTDLGSLYTGWLALAIAMRAYQRTGMFNVVQGTAKAKERWRSLQELERLDADMAKVQNSAKRATQMARQVELNTELQTLRKRHAAALERI
ncbi:MAG: DUF4391 domain-containing protein [Candidatus Paceibacterota bacterium]